VILTNAGFIYFESEIEKETEMEPENFTPLTDFCVLQVDPSVSTHYTNFFSKFKGASSFSKWCSVRPRC